MKNVHLLATPNPSRLYYLGNSSELTLSKYTSLFRAFERSTQQLYITANGKFNRGDYVTDGIGVMKASPKLVDAQGLIDRREWKRIILTTDSALINERVQAIPEEFLKWYIENQNCKEVEIGNQSIKSFDTGHFEDFYKIIIPKEEPKQDEIMERFIQNAKQEEPKESNMTTAIRFLEWYRRKRVIFQFHCYHIPGSDETIYLNADQLYRIFEQENY